MQCAKYDAISLQLTCGNMRSAFWAPALMLQRLLQAFSAEVMACNHQNQKRPHTDCASTGTNRCYLQNALNKSELLKLYDEEV